MATVLKSVPKPVHIGDALAALSACQFALQQALPDVGDITIELTPDRDGKGGLFRARIELKPLADPAETVFVLNRNLVEGYRFYAVCHSKASDTRRTVVTANIDVTYAA